MSEPKAPSRHSAAYLGVTHELSRTWTPLPSGFLSFDIISEAGAAPLDSKLQQSSRAGLRTGSFLLTCCVHLFSIV